MNLFESSMELIAIIFYVGIAVAFLGVIMGWCQMSEKEYLKIITDLVRLSAEAIGALNSKNITLYVKLNSKLDVIMDLINEKHNQET